jgi:hypothetical protein
MKPAAAEGRSVRMNEHEIDDRGLGPAEPDRQAGPPGVDSAACPECRGVGVSPDGQTCPVCDGTGRATGRAGGG